MSDGTGKWMTPAALEKLQDEYETLTTEGRDIVVARIAEARAHGDLKENSEYDSAKNDQGLSKTPTSAMSMIREPSRSAPLSP
jgi:transcription elongation factor GreA